MQRDDKLMIAATRGDGREWMRRAGQYAREKHLNVIVQDTAQNPEISAQMMRGYREAGYRVESVSMAVPKEISDQGIQYRYYEQVIDRGVGRLTVQANADQSYEGVSGLARLVDEQHLVDRARLFRRGEASPCYDNSAVQGRWKTDPKLATALRLEREERPWSRAMAASFETMQAEMRSETRPNVLAKLGPTCSATMADLERRAAPKIEESRTAEAGEAVHRGSLGLPPPSQGKTSGAASPERPRPNPPLRERSPDLGR